MLPDEHAVLSPSSAERWISCPASIRMEEQLPGATRVNSSIYAAEGTVAHALAELEASHHFGLITGEEYHQRHAAWVAEYGDKWDIADMARHVKGYVDFLDDASKRFPNTQVLLERRVQTGIEGCWGTADAIMVSPVHIHVTDFKYGMGVSVEAENNPQIKLYGLGALNEYGDLLGEVEEVYLTIYQPRLGAVHHTSMTTSQLIEWRDTVASPAALLTADPDAPFGPSEEACRWCPVRGRCAAQMEWATQLDFGKRPEILSPEEIAEVLALVPGIRQWLSDLEAAALDMAYSQGVPIPGWKVVMSGGRRTIVDQTAAIQALIDAGYKAEDVADFNVKGLGKLEKLVGPARLKEILGSLLQKSDGREALVPESDRRPAISPNTEAAKDFQE